MRSEPPELAGPLKRCFRLFGHPCRLFLGPGLRLGARWNRLGETVKTRKKRGKTGKKWARYGLRSANKEGTGGIPGSQLDRRSDGARRDGGGGDLPGTYPDIKMEYRNDGNRYKVALDAEENPDFRYQVIPWHSFDHTSPP